MEVLKHPHHVTHKKKWSEYLLEFLMLFLAVFLGFVAENFREHSVDARREKKYMYSLMQDVRDDIKSINSHLALGDSVSKNLDSFIHFLNYEDPNKNVSRLYLFSSKAGRIVSVSFNNRTSTQLKNSGSMQLVGNSNLSDSIRNYWIHIENDQEVASRMIDMQSKIFDIWIQLFSNKYYVTDPSNPFATNVSNDTRLISTDPKLITQLSNRANLRLSVLYIYLGHLRSTKEQALRLVDLIKKEYHFE